MINSVDASSNTVISDHSSVFNELREAVTTGVPSPDSEAVLQAVSAMEKAAGTKQFTSRYRDFIAAAAAHMAVVGPFVPLLAELLT